MFDPRQPDDTTPTSPSHRAPSRDDQPQKTEHESTKHIRWINISVGTSLIIFLILVSVTMIFPEGFTQTTTSAPMTPAETEWRLAIIEAKDQLRDASDTRTDYILTLLGVLITALVLLITLRTEKSAVESAINKVKEETADLKDGFEIKKAEIEELLKTAKHYASQIKNTHDTVIPIANKLINNQDLNPEEQDSFEKAFTEARTKAPLERNHEDYRVLIGGLIQLEKYEQAKELAITMRTIIGTDLAIADSYFAESSCNFLSDKFTDALKSVNEVIKRFKHTNDPEVRHTLARAMTNRVHYLVKIADGDKAGLEKVMKAADEMLEHFKDSDHPDILWQIAMTMSNRALYLSQIAGNDQTIQQQAIDSADEMIKQFSSTQHSRFTPLLAQTMTNRATTLIAKADNNTKELESILKDIDTIIAQFKNEDDIGVLHHLARAMSQRTALIGTIAGSDIAGLKKALQSSEDMISRFKNFNEAEIMPSLANTMANRVTLYGLISQQENTTAEQAYKAAYEMHERFKSCEDIKVLRILANTMSKLTLTLTLLSETDPTQMEEAIQTAEDIIKRFHGIDDIEVRRVLAEVRKYQIISILRQVALGNYTQETLNDSVDKMMKEFQKDNDSIIIGNVDDVKEYIESLTEISIGDYPINSMQTNSISFQYDAFFSNTNTTPDDDENQ